MESSGRAPLTRSHISRLRLVFMWLVKMPLLSPINHGPLSPAMPSTAGDNIDLEWCCCRLSNYTQHGKGSHKAWLWYVSQPYRRFCCFIWHVYIQIRVYWLNGCMVWICSYSWISGLLPVSRNLPALWCGHKNPAYDCGLWLVVLWSYQPTNILARGRALSSWGWWWHTCSADKVPGPPGL